mmetsp:Transcript_36228/g.72129  ORF Transcript_36228/g.72129 Transcript_36228/m.72129 type:complete len:396 (-) Transcript_36228:362-1549(-)
MAPAFGDSTATTRHHVCGRKVQALTWGEDHGLGSIRPELHHRHPFPAPRVRPGEHSQLSWLTSALHDLEVEWATRCAAASTASTPYAAQNPSASSKSAGKEFPMLLGSDSFSSSSRRERQCYECASSANPFAQGPPSKSDEAGDAHRIDERERFRRLRASKPMSIISRRASCRSRRHVRLGTTEIIEVECWKAETRAMNTPTLTIECDMCGMRYSRSGAFPSSSRRIVKMDPSTWLCTGCVPQAIASATSRGHRAASAPCRRATPPASTWDGAPTPPRGTAAPRHQPSVSASVGTLASARRQNPPCGSLDILVAQAREAREFREARDSREERHCGFFGGAPSGTARPPPAPPTQQWAVPRPTLRPPDLFSGSCGLRPLALATQQVGGNVLPVPAF